jgi:RNA polymerase sigma-70 factor (ECF subfamily)
MGLLVPEQDSEKSLIEKAIQRDRSAFTALYDRYVDQVYRHVYYKLSNRTEAEDITQETFVKAWKAIHKFKQTGAPFVAWLITIARHLIADHYKKRPNLVNLDDLVLPASDHPSSDPQRMAEASFNQEMVRKAVLKLKDDQQKVVMMRFIDGLSYAEIAQALGKSEGAVRVIQFRALSGLKQILPQD